MFSIFQKKSLSAIVAVALPTFVLFSGLYELFPAPGWVDPMIYVGYFLDPAEQIWRYGPLYYSGRVPYIFVGHLFYSVFSPVSAHYATLLFFNGLALGAVFLAAYRLYGRNVAILSTWWLGLNPLWVNSVSTGYVDGPAMAFGFVAFACSVFGATQSRLISANASLVASGFFVSLTMVIHPVPGGLAALAVFATCLAMNDGWSALRDIAYVALGGILGLTLSTIYALQLGAPTIFSFFNQGPMASLSIGHISLFAIPLGQWLPGSYWAVTPLVLLILSFLTVRKARKSAVPLSIVGMLCLTIAFIFLLLWDAVFGGATLQEHFYVSYLIYGETILVISILGSFQQSLPASGLKEVRVFLAVAAAAIAPLTWQYFFGAPHGSVSYQILWFLLIVFVVAVSFLFQAQRSVVTIASVMALTMFSGVLNAGTRLAFAEVNHPSYKLVFEEVVAIRKLADLTYLHGRNVFIWGNRRLGLTGKDDKKRFSYSMSYTGKQERFNALDSLAALWVWDKGALGFEMPTLQNADVKRLQRSRNAGSVVIVCLRQQDCDQGVVALNRAGLPTSIRASSSVWIPGLEPARVVIADF